MKVVREFYLRQLEARRHNGLVKIITGVRRSGDFFARIVVTEGLRPPMKDETGIIHVGVIPFLLDELILDTALETSRQ